MNITMTIRQGRKTRRKNLIIMYKVPSSIYSIYTLNKREPSTLFYPYPHRLHVNRTSDNFTTRHIEPARSLHLLDYLRNDNDLAATALIEKYIK